MPLFQTLCHFLREGPRLRIAHLCVEGNVELQTLGAGNFRQALQAVRVKKVPQVKGHHGAGDKISTLTRIEIKYYRRRTVELAGPMQKRMQLQTRNIGAPY